ncbi:MAG: right-handed parallel beta-helix repeat-containing protein, partial [Nocardioides sp.]
MRRIVTVSLTAAAVFLALLFIPAPGAQAHVERPAYWPNPKADCSIRPCAGGAVPKARSLRSALAAKPAGETRVVCQANSMARLQRAVRSARTDGYNIRPTVHKSLSAKKGRQLIKINRRLFKLCDFNQIQAAVTASGNNDRVVVMPGLYREAYSRRQPTDDPSCAKYHMESDKGDPGALSHDAQLNCPNDANLVAVIGRGLDTAPSPDKPRTDRHGIPNVGKCIRCNLQLEGSGVSADDVIIEAGAASAGNGGPSAAGHKKDVGVFVDRADGFVLRNMTIRHAREHDIYILETDGYLLDRFKVFYAGAYGVLTFTADHGVMQNCDAAGHGDSGLYPGSGAASTADRYKKFYPTWRYSQVVRSCDSHHNASGFSGTNSHATLVTRNNFYDNALGFTSDVFTAAGHPGFPQRGNTISKNNFYDNNFNPFVKTSDVEPFIAAPVGTGLWLAGGNSNTVSDNHFYDNWRRGTMLFAVPD